MRKNFSFFFISGHWLWDFCFLFKKFSTWANRFRPFGQNFLTCTSERNYLRPFSYLEICWVILRKIREQIEKKSETLRIFVTWEKNIGSNVFRQRCWSCKLQSMCPFKQLASFWYLNNRESLWDNEQKIVRTPENAFSSDFKTAFFSTGEGFEKSYCLKKHVHFSPKPFKNRYLPSFSDIERQFL